MGSTLTNGIYLPAEGERNCYTGLAANWSALDSLIGGYNAHIGNTTIHVTAEDKQAWNGKADASALTAHTGDTTIHVTAEDKQAWNGKADASALTAHTGNTTIHVTAAEKETWNGKADNSALTAHTGNTTIHVTAEDKEAWNGKADNSALTAHTGNTTIHVTAEDKQAWNGKADSSALTAHTGNTTIHVTAADKEAWNGKADTSALNAHTGDTTIHVTAEDKAKWDAVTSKADDSDVVHKSGNETINGNKTFSSINGVEPSSLFLPDLNNGIDISSYITVVANANKESFYTPPANGWISVALNTGGVMLKQGNLASSGRNITRENGTTSCNAMLPVKGGVQVSINSALANGIVFAYFYPCRGNV